MKTCPYCSVPSRSYHKLVFICFLLEYVGEVRTHMTLERMHGEVQPQNGARAEDPAQLKPDMQAWL